MSHAIPMLAPHMAHVVGLGLTGIVLVAVETEPVLDKQSPEIIEIQIEPLTDHSAVVPYRQINVGIPGDCKLGCLSRFHRITSSHRQTHARRTTCQAGSSGTWW